MPLCRRHIASVASQENGEARAPQTPCALHPKQDQLVGANHRPAVVTRATLSGARLRDLRSRATTAPLPSSLSRCEGRWPGTNRRRCVTLRRGSPVTGWVPGSVLNTGEWIRTGQTTCRYPTRRSAAGRPFWTLSRRSSSSADHRWCWSRLTASSAVAAVTVGRPPDWNDPQPHEHWQTKRRPDFVGNTRRPVWPRASALRTNSARPTSATAPVSPRSRNGAPVIEEE